MSRARDLADGTFSGAFSADSPTLVVDDTNNRVGLGTTSPTDLLHLSAGAGFNILLERTGASPSECFIKNSGNMLQFSNDVSGIRFDTGVTPTEAARIDSSGNLLVGKTSTAVNDVGVIVQSDGRFFATSDGSQPGVFNRKTSDGAIVDFRKDNTTAGTIGNSGAYMYLASKGASSRGVKITDNFIPADTSGNNNDNAMDLGGASVRWDDVYATNPTIQTSDANEKEQIASLTDAEITAAKAISKLFKTFKWKDKVAEKGDAARTHSGVIAQEVQQALADAGLDAGDYAFFISSTWWEADETYTDDDGVEQTRTITYDTAEEAPVGATERNRKGIRYPELLSFIGAATEQRLASIEARLDALEAV